MGISWVDIRDAITYPSRMVFDFAVDQLFDAPEISISGDKLDSSDIVGDSSYGVPIKKIFGRCRIAGNLIWVSPFVETPITKEEGGVTYTNYNYSCSFAVAFSEGVIEKVEQIYARVLLLYDDKEGIELLPVYYADVDGALFNEDGSLATNDTTTLSELLDYERSFATLGPISSIISGDGLPNVEQSKPDDGGYGYAVVYRGTETQQPDKTINDGVGYRGVFYIVFNNFQLKKFGNMIPNISVTVSAREGTIPVGYDTYNNSDLSDDSNLILGYKNTLDGKADRDVASKR